MMKIKTLVAAAAFASTGSAFAMIGNPTVTTDGGERTVTRTFRILPSGSCSKKGRSKGGSGGGQLCGTTNHF